MGKSRDPLRKIEFGCVRARRANPSMVQRAARARGTNGLERSGLVKLPEQPLLLASFVEFSEHLVGPAQAFPAPEVTAFGIELAAVDAPAGPRRRLGLSARPGDLRDVPMGVAVERDKRDPVGLSDLTERIAAAEGRFNCDAFWMGADCADT